MEQKKKKRKNISKNNFRGLEFVEGVFRYDSQGVNHCKLPKNVSLVINKIERVEDITN